MNYEFHRSIAASQHRSIAASQQVLFDGNSKFKIEN